MHHALLHAYERGRELMEADAGVLDIVRLHTAAVADLEPEHRESLSWRARADAFLAEVLAPFEMAYLGFKEANSSLRRLTATLEEQVQQRTHELRESLSALQAAHVERRALLARLVSAQEQERQRISDDLHDDTIQVLTGVALRLSTLRHQVAPEAQAALDRLEQIVDDSIGRLRRLMFELRPPVLDREGLAAAIHVYLRMALGEVEATVADRLDQQPPVHARETAYRIAQEALANVRKHAHANRVAVRLEPHRGGVRVTITDDGRGFHPHVLDRPDPGHLGVTSMRERAALAGGECTIESQPGQGTPVPCWIPAGS
jgi:signal transduction histidine kinase